MSKTMTPLDHFAAQEKTEPLDYERNRIAKEMGFDNEREVKRFGGRKALYARYRYECAQAMMEERERLKGKATVSTGELRAAITGALEFVGRLTAAADEYKEKDNESAVLAEEVLLWSTRAMDILNGVTEDDEHPSADAAGQPKAG